MNGSERETRQPQNVSGYTRKKELTDEEKMELVVFSSTPTAKTIYKIMEIEIENARDDAMEADPSDQAKQLSMMTIAHAMDKFYKKVRGHIDFAMQQHVTDVRLKVQAEELKDREKLEEIIFKNSTGSL